MNKKKRLIKFHSPSSPPSPSIVSLLKIFFSLSLSISKIPCSFFNQFAKFRTKLLFNEILNLDSKPYESSSSSPFYSPLRTLTTIEGSETWTHSRYRRKFALAWNDTVYANTPHVPLILPPIPPNLWILTPIPPDLWISIQFHSLFLLNRFIISFVIAK